MVAEDEGAGVDPDEVAVAEDAVEALLRNRPPQTETEGKGPPSITPDNIVYWACGKKGHRSNKCPMKQVHFAGLAEDEIIYYSAVQSITSGDTVTHVLLSAATRADDTIILLNTQSGIYLLHSPALAIHIQDILSPVTIQEITGNRVRIREEATIKDIGIKGYCSPRMSANIISYSKLKETHSVYYDEDTDIFVAAASTRPKLTFHCVNGHYVMDMVESVPVYVINGPAKYSIRQLATTNSLNAWNTSVTKEQLRWFKEDALKISMLRGLTL